MQAHIRHDFNTLVGSFKKTTAEDKKNRPLAKSEYCPNCSRCYRNYLGKVITSDECDCVWCGTK